MRCGESGDRVDRPLRSLSEIKEGFQEEVTSELKEKVGNHEGKRRSVSDGENRM